MDTQFIYIASVTFIAIFIGTLAGFGTSTIMVPAFLVFYSLPETLLLAGIVHWFGSVWKMLLFRSGIDWRLIILFGLPAALAGFIGAYLTIVIPQETLSRVIGAALICYVLLLYIRPCCELPVAMRTTVAGGALYGFVAGLMGVGGEIRSAFLSAFNLQKVTYIATTGGIALIVDSTRIAAYSLNGMALNSILISSVAILIIISLLGSATARKLVNIIPQDRYRSVVAGFLFLAGIKLTVMP